MSLLFFAPLSIEVYRDVIEHSTSHLATTMSLEGLCISLCVCVCKSLCECVLQVKVSERRRHLFNLKDAKSLITPMRKVEDMLGDSRGKILFLVHVFTIFFLFQSRI